LIFCFTAICPLLEDGNYQFDGLREVRESDGEFRARVNDHASPIAGPDLDYLAQRSISLGVRSENR
jgi:hypothetical protein